ncbi:hypothetical protein CRE_31559 [Caenorhabditis remanei]|uniref:COMM domain-containing protein n=1 Tax=Caenorhabditis remanei TaxID=31234 RepID=E3NKM3_CAERE|nr:hypothetical protein CRE_31559 [Caenorhabditis remanei]
MDPILSEWDDSQSIVKSKITNRASIRILERYPLKETDVETLFEAEEMAGGEPEELYKLCRQLLNVWKYAIFFQPKPENFVELLQEKNYPPPVIKGLLEAYTSETTAEIVEHLATASHSAIPRVLSTDWSCRTVTRRNDVATSDREAILTFSTVDGVKRIELSGRDLEKLYWSVNRVQTSLDSLLER